MFAARILKKHLQPNLVCCSSASKWFTNVCSRCRCWPVGFHILEFNFYKTRRVSLYNSTKEISQQPVNVNTNINSFVVLCCRDCVCVPNYSLSLYSALLLTRALLVSSAEVENERRKKEYKVIFYDVFLFHITSPNPQCNCTVTFKELN